jgi:hypothetical protein
VDVLVAGGGLAGVSAAVGAARAGARTLLLERNGFPGGVATAGMCCSVFNCFYTPSHELVVRGNSRDFVDELARAGGAGGHWHEHRGHIVYDVERGKLALTELLERAGAGYLFDALVVDVIQEGDALQGAVIESKSGREAIRARVVVDATGDADVAHRAGAPLRHTSELGWARHSYVFRIGNVDVDRFAQYFADHPEQYADYMDVDWTVDDALRQYRETGTFLFPHGGGIQMDLIKQGLASGEYPTAIGVHDDLAALQMHALRNPGVVHVITGFCELPDLDVGRITRAMADGRRLAFAVTDYFRRYVPGFERAYVTATADDLGIRASRWLDGEFVFTSAMKSEPTRFEDAVGRGVVEHDYVKNLAPGAWGCQTFLDATFDLPYRCLLPRRVEGLLMGSGRSVSAENPFLLRCMALTMVVGQGAGVAAAVSARKGTPPRSVDVSRVQEELTRQGVVLR